MSEEPKKEPMSVAEAARLQREYAERRRRWRLENPLEVVAGKKGDDSGTKPLL